MMPRWQWLLLFVARKLWLRVALFSLVAVLTAVAGIVFAPYVPSSWTTKIGADSIDGILNILASSMLAVTIFSIGTMVSVYSAAIANITPRVAKLLTDDNTSKNVLGTFIGTFLYSLVGIIALSTGAYEDQGRAILMAVTVGVIILIAGTLMRWIDYLSRFGRVGEIITKVERATQKAMTERIKDPALGGREIIADEDAILLHAKPIHADDIGYVDHVDVEALFECAKEGNGEIFVMAVPGTFVDPSRPIAMVRELDPETVKTPIIKAFTIGNERTFDQDPRFGLCVLAEIASRALSPGVNDPGTAIDVIGRAVRLMVTWGQGIDQSNDRNIPYPLVRVPAMRVDDMFNDIFRPLARDGSTLLEVQTRLQKAFLALLEVGNDEFKQAVLRQSAIALAHTEAGFELDEDKAIVRALAAKIKSSRR